jgi:cardiolipin synthase
MTDLTLVGAGHLVLGLLLTFDVLMHKHRPVSAVLWMGIVWTLPYGGAVLYLTFGMDRVRRSTRAREAAGALVAQRAMAHPTAERLVASSPAWRVARYQGHPASRILRATDLAVHSYWLVPGNKVSLLVDGDDFYPELFRAIEAAQKTIHLQTFIYARDDFGWELLARLTRKARDGVTVRLLYDRFGSSGAFFSRMFEPAKKAGVRARSISQANPLKGRFQINLRNHRKVAVIDGQTAFAGGINISAENLSRHTGGEPIRDYHCRLEGPAVADLQLQFLQDWYYATREPLDRLVHDDMFPRLAEAGTGLVKIVPGGPVRHGQGLDDAMFAAITAAEESLKITTPYFVPDEPIVEAIRIAALKGVAVDLVVPRKNNHWYTGAAARSLYGPLLKVGVRIHERYPPFMHAKSMVIDGQVALVGSANLDYRSLHLNFETNLLVADDAFVASLTRQIDREIEASVSVVLDEHEARPVSRRLVQNFCYLFQPLL